MYSNEETAKSAPRILGAMFLIVIVISLVSGVVLSLSGSISDILVKISDNLTLMRISILFGLLNSLGIVALASLLYTVLNQQNRIIALVALGLWLSEAIFYAISQIGAFALIPLSQDFVKAGTPEHSFYQTLGDFLYFGVDKQAVTIHMWFYCLGGILWYFLFYKSKFIPSAISLFGLIAASLGLVGVVCEFLGAEVPIFVYLPLLPFELTIGLWLMLRGIKDSSKI
ncbi:MAG: DUF4386 domain-containing protein [Chloroflexi bacterium]|uniref:DUF4386 domain-containing protein n=1 Tax=Candidatus Chlorohelix allophototropha TaxID=3003348 RepID=A0A8T7MAB0_9CHLR|nr:DUF4386 domain-containing protein [Chloroflexota bacterium]WJW68784.1 DUF4386 domain-containing protein [Chloroflexota bacterium L227-S17]